MSAKVILTVTQGKLKGQKFIFNSRTTSIIGRASDCYPQIPDDRYHRTISRYHCLLDINPPDIRIKDLGSLHGTYISGKLIGKRKIKQKSAVKNNPQHFEYDLQNNDEIKLSNTVFRVNIEPEIAPTLKFASPNLEVAQQANNNQITPPKLNLKGFMRDLIERANQGDESLRSLKNYAILDRLGAGGFSEVYLARHQKTQELVAIKIMLPKIAANQQKVNLFLREIENTQNLHHPYVVQLKDYCFTDGVFFCTLEYCPGGTVLDLMRLRGGKLALDEALPIIVKVLEALHYAHRERGLVHRDLKPANIFLAWENSQTVAKLGDYGIAKAFDKAGLSGQTMTGTLGGTPVFMSRQQVLDFKYAQPEVDIWASAATLYYMLTGFYPRDFGEMDPFVTILQTEPIPISQRGISLPKPLADLIDLALLDNPQIYFRNAKAFKTALLSVI